MTREEAIEVLQQDIPCEQDTDLIEAIDMAIKALEMIEEFERAQIITGGRLNGRTYAYKCGLEDGKRKALEQEPRKGKWTKISNTAPCMNCPICGSTFTLILGGDKMHYCPNCGADMRGEEV